MSERGDERRGLVERIKGAVSSAKTAVQSAYMDPTLLAFRARCPLPEVPGPGDEDAVFEERARACAGALSTINVLTVDSFAARDELLKERERFRVRRDEILQELDVKRALAAAPLARRYAEDLEEERVLLARHLEERKKDPSVETERRHAEEHLPVRIRLRESTAAVQRLHLGIPRTLLNEAEKARMTAQEAQRLLEDTSRRVRVAKAFRDPEERNVASEIRYDVETAKLEQKLPELEAKACSARAEHEQLEAKVARAKARLLEGKRP